jgi:hypothetical protein
MMLRACLSTTLLLLIGCGTTPQTSPASSDVQQVRDEHRLLALYSNNPLPKMKTLEQRRIETPHGPLTLQCYAPGGRDLPVILLLPSIDFQSGDVVTHDRIARTLAIDTPAVVILPALPQAPEATLRTSTEVAAATLDWMTTRLERLGGSMNCLVIVGEGAAALHALKLAGMQRHRNDDTIRGLVLVTPVLDPYDVTAVESPHALPDTFILPATEGPDRDTALELATALDANGTTTSTRTQQVTEPLRLAWALADPDVYDTMLEVTRLVRSLAAECSGTQASDTF